MRYRRIQIVVTYITFSLVLGINCLSGQTKDQKFESIQNKYQDQIYISNSALYEMYDIVKMRNGLVNPIFSSENTDFDPKIITDKIIGFSENFAKRPGTANDFSLLCFLSLKPISLEAKYKPNDFKSDIDDVSGWSDSDIKELCFFADYYFSRRISLLRAHVTQKSTDLLSSINSNQNFTAGLMDTYADYKDIVTLQRRLSNEMSEDLDVLNDLYITIAELAEQNRSEFQALKRRDLGTYISIEESIHSMKIQEQGIDFKTESKTFTPGLNLQFDQPQSHDCSVLDKKLSNYESLVIPGGKDGTQLKLESEYRIEHQTIPAGTYNLSFQANNKKEVTIYLAPKEDPFVITPSIVYSFKVDRKKIACQGGSGLDFSFETTSNDAKQARLNLIYGKMQAVLEFEKIGL